MRVDPTEPRCLVVEPLLDLGVAKPQHAAQLLDRRFDPEQVANLFEAEAEIAKGAKLVQTGELSRSVGPVTGAGVDTLRP